MYKPILTMSLGILLSGQAMAKDMYVSAQAGLAMPVGDLKVLSIISEDVRKESLTRSPIYSLMIGKRVKDGLFAELEYVHSPDHKFSRRGMEYEHSSSATYAHDVDTKGKVSSSAAFINAKYKFEAQDMHVIPYVVAGIGYSVNKTAPTVYSIMDMHQEEGAANMVAKGKKTNDLAWQVGAGIVIPVKSYINIDLSLKYRNFGKFSSASMVTDHQGKNYKLTSNALRGDASVTSFMVGFSLDF